MSVRCADFRQGIWEVSPDGKWVTDKTTGKTYTNDSLEKIQCKACGILTYGPCYNTALSLGCMCARSVKLVTCYHCWKDEESNSGYTQMGSKPEPLTCKKRMGDLGIDATKLICAPFLCATEQCLLCITLIQPSRNVKKYVNSFDEMQFDRKFRVACSFQPHDSGGGPTKQVMSVATKDDTVELVIKS